MYRSAGAEAKTRASVRPRWNLATTACLSAPTSRFKYASPSVTVKGKDDAGTRATVPPPHSSRELNLGKMIPALRRPVSVPLGRLEMTVFARIDGRRAVTDIASEVGLSPFEVLRIIERLMELVPDLTLGESEVVELSTDDLWDVEDAGKTGETPSTKR